MRVVLAPDKFKGTLTARQAAEIMARAIRSVHPDASIAELPLADGGEGTVQTLTHALGGTFRSVTVHDPIGRLRKAEFGIAGKTAVIEMAAASGMALLEQRELNPLQTSTFGTGELIRAALDAEVREIVIGIGGSATVDGGAGMAEALGYSFYNAQEEPMFRLAGGTLSAIRYLDTLHADPRLRECRIRIASDVANPLLGPDGAAAVFAPQKGATPEMLPILESGLANLHRQLVAERLLSPADLPGDGAAGGLGMGLRAFCGALPESGARLAMDLTGFESLIDGADYVITGEGCTDSQTESGKLCSEIRTVCRKRNVRCILLSGCILNNAGAGFYRAVPCCEPGLPFEEIRRNAERNLFSAACRLAERL